MVVNIGLVA